MSEPHGELVLAGPSEAFESWWEEVGARLGLRVRRAAEVADARGGDAVAVVLHCAGTEDRALDLLHEAQRSGVADPVVVTAAADHRLAVSLLRRGAAAYFALPDDAEQLEAELAGRVEAAPEREAATLEAYRRQAHDFSEIVGEDPALQAALDRAARVIPGGRATVLITGETGTGKELLARAIHYNGPRAAEPFVAVNCSAIPGTLIESELFGHEKGAFTDARATKPGLFEAADGGTLFLDEVSTLPLELQAKLLRALETRSVRHVGGLRDIEVDIRVVAAANVDLAERIEAGEFREDLYYRLAVIPIRLPALRERRDDVLVLARHFLGHLAADYGLERPELSPGARRALERHEWPGNVRELRNAIERALLLSAGGPIHAEHLDLQAAGGGREVSPAGSGDGPAPLPFPAPLREIEAAAARAAVERTGGNKSEAAGILEISRTRLYRLLDAD